MTIMTYRLLDRQVNRQIGALDKARHEEQILLLFDKTLTLT